MKVRKVVFAAIGAVVGVCSCAYADGVFVWRKGVDLYGPSQKAIILWDDGYENLILQVKYKGEASDFAWIVPVPSEPDVRAVDGDIFAEISEYTQRRRWWNAFYHFRRKGIPPGVEVVKREKVSVYDVAVLNARDSQALILWLNENGFSIPVKARRVLQDYIRKKWTFVALRIHPDEEKLWVEKSLNEGTLVPLKFTFLSKEIVYPLKLSSLNKGETEVLLYVFYKDAVVHPDFLADAPRVGEFYVYAMDPNSTLDSFDSKLWERDRKAFPKYFDYERKFFRAVTKDELPLCRKALPRLKSKRFFLSKLRNTFKTEQMKFDVVLKPIEEFNVEEQCHFVKKQVEMKVRGAIETKEDVLSFSNSLLLRTPDQVAVYIDQRRVTPPVVRSYAFRQGFEFLAHFPSERVLEVMHTAVSADPQVVKSLGDALYYHARGYGLDEKFIPVLKRLAYQETGGHHACEVLREIGSDDAVEVLSTYAVEPRHSLRRQSALENLSKLKLPRLIDVYKRAINSKLTYEETFSCLRGLELINDPRAYPLVEQIVKQNESEMLAFARELLEKWRNNRESADD